MRDDGAVPFPPCFFSHSSTSVPNSPISSNAKHTPSRAVLYPKVQTSLPPAAAGNGLHLPVQSRKGKKRGGRSFENGIIKASQSEKNNRSNSQRNEHVSIQTSAHSQTYRERVARPRSYSSSSLEKRKRGGKCLILRKKPILYS